MVPEECREHRSFLEKTLGPSLEELGEVKGERESHEEYSPGRAQEKKMWSRDCAGPSWSEAENVPENQGDGKLKGSRWART